MSKLFKSYKYRATKSGKDFNISESKFDNLTTGCCYYCGIEYDKEYKDGKFNGIDRYNNGAGYVNDNCVPACWICNRAKNDLSVVDFYLWIKRIVGNYKHLTDPTLNHDQVLKIEFNRNKKSNIIEIASYEQSVLDRGVNLLMGCCFPESLATRIVKYASQNKKSLKWLVQFCYNVDMCLYPESTQNILDTLGKPEYLEGVRISQQLSIACLDPILANISVKKHELKYMIDKTKDGFYLKSGLSN